jgi:hypothetical protein
MSLLRHVLAIAAILCLFERAVSAQILPSVDVRTWRPSTDPSASLVLEPMATPGPWNWSVGAWLDYTNRPVTITENGGPTALHPIENLLGSDVTASLGLGKRASVGIDLPMFLYQNGSGGLPAAAVTSRHVPTTGLGDLAVTGKGAIVDNADGGFGLAVLAAVTAPTGDLESFMGQGSATVTARALADYSLVFGDLQASVGYTLLTQHHTWLGVSFGDSVPWSIGVLFHPIVVRALDKQDRQSWEVAVHGSFPAGSSNLGSQALSPALLALSDRIALGHYRDTYLLLGADIGLTNAIGVPTVRAIASIGWAPRSHDRDHDGIPDDVDQCPDIPEDRDGFEDMDGCPDHDDDGDGIPDREDACPREKGVPDADPKKNGCPAAPESKHEILPPPNPDRDGDGIANAEDACPDVPGEPDPDPGRNGCPNPDHDGDTFDDDVDQCPQEPEVFNGVKDDDGCPDEGGHPLVTVDTKDPRLPVRLAAPIQFASGAEGAAGAVAIDAASLSTLRAIAQILNRHRDWTLAVGVKPTVAMPAESAVARAATIARELGRLAHRDSAAEPVAWDSVAKQPGGESGVAFLVLVGAEKPDKPQMLHVVPSAGVPGAPP